MFKNYLAAALSIFILCGCFGHKQPQNKIITNSAVVAPTFSTKGMSAEIVYGLNDVFENGFAYGKVNLLKSFVAKNTTMTQEQKKEVTDYLNTITATYEDNLIFSVEGYLALNKGKKLDSKKCSPEDLTNVSLAILALYKKDKNDPRVEEWKARLPEDIRKVVQYGIDTADVNDMQKEALKKVEEYKYVKITPDATEETTLALVKTCKDIVWYAGYPRIAGELLKTIPKQDISTSMKNFEKAAPKMEELRKFSVIKFEEPCTLSTEKLIQYFNEQELKSFLNYFDNIYVLQIGDPSLLRSYFTSSSNPAAVARKRINEKLIPKEKEMYAGNQKELNDSAIILNVFTKFIADEVTKLVPKAPDAIIK